MAENQATNEERSQAADLRQAQKKARLVQAGIIQAAAGKKMRAGGEAVDSAGRNMRKGGVSMMKSGAQRGLAGLPMVAAGGIKAAAGLATQATGKAVKGTGRGVEKGGRTAKSTTIREAVLKKKNEDKAKGAIAEAASGMAQTATGGLLKSAWSYLIPSWGLTLIWINIHVFLSWVMSGVFCKLGEEWIPKSMKKISGTASALLRIGEGMLLLILDSLAALLILGILAIVVMTVNALTPKGALETVLGITSSSMTIINGK